MTLKLRFFFKVNNLLMQVDCTFVQPNLKLNRNSLFNIANLRLKYLRLNFLFTFIN